jgi:hypothetical protein
MTNLLKQAINTDDGDCAAKLIRMRWVSRAMMSRTIASRRRGPRIVNSALGSSAIG